MDTNKLESVLIDYIDGKLSEAKRFEVEDELKRNPESYRLYEQLLEVLTAISKSGEMEPDQRLRHDFEKILKKEIEDSRKMGSSSRPVFFQPVIYRAAAAIVLLISGIAIGFWINKNQQQEADLLALR